MSKISLIVMLFVFGCSSSTNQEASHRKNSPNQNNIYALESPGPIYPPLEGGGCYADQAVCGSGCCFVTQTCTTAANGSHGCLGPTPTPTPPPTPTPTIDPNIDLVYPPLETGGCYPDQFVCDVGCCFTTQQCIPQSNGHMGCRGPTPKPTPVSTPTATPSDIPSGVPYVPPTPTPTLTPTPVPSATPLIGPVYPPLETGGCASDQYQCGQSGCCYTSQMCALQANGWPGCLGPTSRPTASPTTTPTPDPNINPVYPPLETGGCGSNMIACADACCFATQQCVMQPNGNPGCKGSTPSPTATPTATPTPDPNGVPYVSPTSTPIQSNPVKTPIPSIVPVSPPYESGLCPTGDVNCGNNGCCQAQQRCILDNYGNGSCGNF